MIRPHLVLSGAVLTVLSLLSPHPASAQPRPTASSVDTPTAVAEPSTARNQIVDGAPAFWLDIGGPFDPPKPATPEESQVLDINDSGVALSYGSEGYYRYDVQSGEVAHLGTIDELRANAIDHQGRIVGNMKVSAGVRHAMIIEPGSTDPVDIGTLPDDTFSESSAVNTAGTVVGISRGVHDSVFAYDLTTETMTDLGSMGGTNPRPRAVSAEGVVVGTVQTGGESKAFAFDIPADSLIPLDTPPGGTHTSPAGVGGGFIAGSAEIAGMWTPVGWDLETGAVTLIDTPDCNYSDVNNAGVAVGNCWNESGSIGSYVGTLDLAEPTTDVVMVRPPPVAGPRYNRHANANSITDSGLIGGSAEFDVGGHAAVYGPFTFNDVHESHPFFADIGWLAHEDITSGLPDGTFGAGKPITRQSMAAFMYRMAGSPWQTVGTFPFDDCDGIRFRMEVFWLFWEDIAAGFPDGGFHPNASVTRQSMSAFLYRLAGSPAFTPPSTPSFPDVPTTHPFYAEIEWMADEAITTGFADGNFRPGSIVTRQSMAAFLHRFADGPGVGV